MKKFIKYNQLNEIFEYLKDKDVYFDRKSYDLFHYDNENKRRNIIRLAISLPSIESSWEEYINYNKKFKFLIVIIQAGQASIGVFNNNLDILEHKVLRTYMVRKKQGKNQIKHLKTKGKSRLGSRIRLNNTLNFFEDINSYINKFYNKHQIDRVLYHIPDIMKNIWKTTKNKLEFSINDKICITIPYSIKSPTFEEIRKIAKFSLDAEIKEENYFKDLFLE